MTLGARTTEADRSHRARPVDGSLPRPRLVERAHNLPAPLSSFVGRDREIARVADAIRNDRFVTLTGPGGIGKTRLALAVATSLLEDFSDGVWLAELAALSNPRLVPTAIATIFRVPGESGTALVDVLAHVLRPRSLLLILDNCEHLLEACADLATGLLRGCPDLRILATSREALHVEGERVWPVPPLSMPDSVAEPADQSESLHLFVERARAASPNFALTSANAESIIGVCRKLEGLPLAIELAAAQTRALTPAAILKRLDGQLRRIARGPHSAPLRHQTMQAAIDWSFALLTVPEQLLFSRLGVFAGSWTIEAVESIVSGNDIPREEPRNRTRARHCRTDRRAARREHPGKARSAVQDADRSLGFYTRKPIAHWWAQTCVFLRMPICASTV